MADFLLDSLYLRRRGVFFVGRRSGTEQGLSSALKQGGERCRIGRGAETGKGVSDMMHSKDFFDWSLQNRKLRVLKTVLGTAGIFPASRSCISPHPENKAKVTPKRRRKKSHSNGTAGRQGIKVF